MKSIPLALLTIIALLGSGCVSAYMTHYTGRKINLPEGTPRTEVIETLGEPEEITKEISTIYRKEFRHSKKKIERLEIHRYRGKINTVDEGGAQATVGAITLGISEVFMIPATAADIAERSFEKHKIYVFYDESDEVVGLLIDPKNEK